METAPALGKSSTGMQPNFAALLSYVFGVITGLIFFLVEKESSFVKFHAMQSICFSVAALVLGLVVSALVRLIIFVVWIVLMVQAWKGKWFRLPIAGDVAAKQAGIQ